MKYTPIERFVKLEGTIQHYAWGGYDFLPQLLNIPNSDHKPFAEYWLGMHANAPATVKHPRMGYDLPLDDYIDILKDTYLSLIKEKENIPSLQKNVPYLLKLLDIRDMLSIQVHPCKEDSYIGFERENQAGIPLDAFNRSYKDNNHKPELMVALSDFWLLHGFRSPEKLIQIISTIPEFAFMLPLFKEGSYRKLYATLMEMEQEEVNRVLQPLLERIQAGYENDHFTKDDPNFWAARAAFTFNQPGKIDRGIFSIYLLNLVHLKKGEAIFQDAGVLHAYLEGQNIEIMANSDNVLRGGLTHKHIDVAELIRHVTFQATIPQLVSTRKDKATQEHIYETPATDFQLGFYTIREGEEMDIKTDTIDILLLLEGEAKMEEYSFYGRYRYDLFEPSKPGDAYALINSRVYIKGIAPQTVIYRATMPVLNPGHDSPK
jgi:mannose-6-phosphate isomerase